MSIEKCPHVEIAELRAQNRALIEALKAIKPMLVRVSKDSLVRVPVYPAEEIDAVVKANGGEA